MSIKIRTFQLQDKPQVVALWHDLLSYDEPHNAPAEAIRRKLANGENLFFVAINDSRVVGTVLAGYDGHRGWIYSLAVERTFQRRGIGTALIREAEEALIQLECPKINLQVVGSNAETVAFYESLGYRVEPRISMGKRIAR